MSTTVTLSRVSVDADRASATGLRPVGSPTRTRTRRAARRGAGPVGARHVHPVPVRGCSVEGRHPGSGELGHVAPDIIRPAAGPVALTRRGRLVALVVLLVATGILSMGVSAATTGAPSDAAAVYETLTVGPGESLWSIARSAAPGADPRATMARIVELNGLDGVGGVRVGQQLTVPVAR